MKLWISMSTDTTEEDEDLGLPKDPSFTKEDKEPNEGETDPKDTKKPKGDVGF